MAREIGVSFQQIQKYESGTNRVSAVLLAEFSNFFHLPMDWFIGPFNTCMERDEPIVTTAYARVLQQLFRGSVSYTHLACEIRLLTDYASDLLLRLDWDGRCRFASPASETILGCPDHAIVMRNFLDLVHPDDRALLTEAFLKQGATSLSSPILRIQHQDGGWRCV